MEKIQGIHGTLHVSKNNLDCKNLDLESRFSRRSSKADKQRLTEYKGYSKKLKIKEVGFKDLKVVNFEKFARVFLVLFSVCYMAFIIVFIYSYTYREKNKCLG